MNNKGQTLVFFVALLPFIFILFVLVFDLSYISSEKAKIDGIATKNIKSLVIDKKPYEEVKKVILKNDKDLDVSYKDETLCLKKEVPVIFGGIIGKESYKIKVCKGIDI